MYISLNEITSISIQNVYICIKFQLAPFKSYIYYKNVKKLYFIAVDISQVIRDNIDREAAEEVSCR